MSTRHLVIGVAILTAIAASSTTASAQRRGQTVVVREVGTPPIPTQPMAVRDVTVRAVRMPPLVVTPPRPISSLSVTPRPFLPSFSRPLGTSFTSSSPKVLRGHRPFSPFKSRVAVIGYPVIYPYAYPYDPFSPTTYPQYPPSQY